MVRGASKSVRRMLTRPLLYAKRCLSDMRRDAVVAYMQKSSKGDKDTDL
jgi:hypothetical protein